MASTRRGGFRGRGYYNRGMGGGMFRGSGGGGGGNPGFRGGYRGPGSRGGNRKPGNQLQSNTGSQNRATNEQSVSQSQANVI